MSLTDPEKQWIAEWAGAIPDAIFPADLATRLPLFVFLEFRQEFPGSQATDAEIEAAGAASVYGSRGAGLVPVEGGDDKRLAAMRAGCDQVLFHPETRGAEIAGRKVAASSPRSTPSRNSRRSGGCSRPWNVVCAFTRNTRGRNGRQNGQ